MLKRVAFLDATGKVTTMRDSVVYVVRAPHPEQGFRESFGLTEVLRDARRGKGVLDGAVIVLPGDEKEFDHFDPLRKERKRKPPHDRVARTRFVFRNGKGRALGRAKSVEELRGIVAKAQLSSVLRHANRGEFAEWLAAVGRKSLARHVKSIRGRGERVRRALMDALA